MTARPVDPPLNALMGANPNPRFSEARLLEIIRIQQEIVQQGLTLDGVMKRVTEKAMALMQASGAIIEIVEGDLMTYRAACGIAEKYIGLQLKRANSLSGLCVEQGVPLVCEDSETDPRVDREACRRVGLRSMVVVPLIFRDSAVGVLKVLSPSPRAFWPEDGEVLQLMAGMIAAAMYHTQPPTKP